MEMRKTMYAKVIVMVMALELCCAHAQIVFNNTDASERNRYAWTFTNLNVENPDVSTANGTAAGLLTGAGSFGVDESFTIEAEGWYGWNTEEAHSAAHDFGVIHFVKAGGETAGRFKELASLCAGAYSKVEGQDAIEAYVSSPKETAR